MQISGSFLRATCDCDLSFDEFPSEVAEVGSIESQGEEEEGENEGVHKYWMYGRGAENFPLESMNENIVAGNI